MFARPRGAFEDIADAVKEQREEERERRERERLHADELAAFDQALGLPPEAFLTRAEFLRLQMSVPRFPGAIYLGNAEYRWVDWKGEEVRCFDDRVKGVTK